MPDVATKLEYLAEDSVDIAKRTAKSLASEARDLADHMTRLAEKMDVVANAEGALPDYIGVNGLGEVQSRGTSIDRLCALVSERAETAGKIAWSLAEPKA